MKLNLNLLLKALRALREGFLDIKINITFNFILFHHACCTVGGNSQWFFGLSFWRSPESFNVEPYTRSFPCPSRAPLW